MSIHVRVLVFVASALAALAPSVASAQSISLVSPGDFADTEGNTGYKIPFAYPPARYQQVYEAADFAALTGPSELVEIAFRPNMGAATFSTTIADVQINLSTTAASVGNISGSYGTNVGPDDTIVHSGPLGLSSSATGPAPRPFDIVIPLATSFFYDPSQGNLLLEVRMIDYTGATTVPFFDGNFVNGAEARVYCSVGCSPDDSGGSTDGGATIARFTFAPEPEAGLLGGMAALALVWLARRGRRFRGAHR